MIHTYKKAAKSLALSMFVFLVMPLAPTNAEEDAADQQQIARGAKAWSENCGRCHNIRDPRELKDYEWDVSVMHMRKIGNLPGEVARDIKAYLKASN